MQLRVHRIPFSTNVERIALAAAHKGIAVEWVDHGADDRSAIRALSGQDFVPVAEIDGAVMVDSPLILRELEERVPFPPLWPADPARRAEADVFVDWFNRVWKRPPNLIAAEEEKPAPDNARIAALAARMRGAMPVFEDLLDGRDYLFGAFGAADVFAFPFLKYAVLGLPAGDDERFHAILVEHQPLGAGSPLRAWVERVDAHPRS
jgi:glutathione S-transferase